MTEKLVTAVMLTLPEVTVERLEREARARGMNRSAYIRKVLAWYLYLQK